MTAARLARRIFMPAAAALALAACSGESNGSGGGVSNVKITPMLKDVVLGEANAPVTVLEYASFTCIHCRDFWKQDFPRLKAAYIDTGKVKYIYRDFPTDPDLAVAAIAISRCKDNGKYYDIVEDLFSSQYDLVEAARQGIAGPALAAIGEKHGVTRDEARACINSKAISDSVNKSIEEGRRREVKSTPTVFVNDKKIDNHSFPYLSAVIEHEIDPSKPLPTEAGEGGVGTQTTTAPAVTATPQAPPAEPAPAQPPSQ